MSQIDYETRLLVGVNLPAEDKKVMDAVLDDGTPVRVLVAQVPYGTPGFPDGAVIPLGILLLPDMFDRVTPVDAVAETTADYAKRVGDGEVA